MTVLGPALIRLATLLAAILALALHEASSASFKPIFKAMFGPLIGFIPGLGSLGNLVERALAKMVAEVDSAISRSAGATLGALGGFLNAMTHALNGYRTRQESFNESVVQTLEHWALHGIPNAIGIGNDVPVARSDHALKRANEAWKKADKAQKAAAGAVGAAKPIPQIQKRLNTQRDAIRDVRDIATKVRDRAKALGGRVTDLEKATAGAAIFAVVLAKLFVRWPWLNCRRLVHPRRGLFARMCGLNSDLFDTLLTDLLIVGGALSVVEFTKDLQAIEDEVIGFMTDTIPELRDLI